MMRPERPHGDDAPMRGVSMLRRRGSVLLTTLIVMLFLATLCLGLMGFVHTNTVSASQEQHIVRARVAAQSVLWSLGKAISEDLGADDPPVTGPLGIQEGKTLTGTFYDPGEGVDVYVEVSRTNPTRYSLTCSARYGDVARTSLGLTISSRTPEGATKPNVTWQWEDG